MFTEVVEEVRGKKVCDPSKVKVPSRKGEGVVEEEDHKDERGNELRRGGIEGSLYPRGHSTPTPRLPRSPDPISRGEKEKKVSANHLNRSSPTLSAAEKKISLTVPD